jgi:SpoVK/Ycf46/Vps4 family AAA+-type ATPase
MLISTTSQTQNIRHIQTLAMSFHPLIVIETVEEERVQTLLQAVTEEMNLSLYEWSVVQGLKRSPGSRQGRWTNEYAPSERNFRQAIALAESMAPAVLWIDEIEKSFTSSSGESDGGLSRHLFGTLLTWMQEKSQDVFVIATANDLSQVPPELLRKGRFDEVFFVDLPNE